MNSLIAIDPGANGAIAWTEDDGNPMAEKMPDGMTAQVDFLRSLKAKLPNVRAVIEHVGFWMPGDHPNSATKFARHCGQLEAALYALGIPFVSIRPKKWMEQLGVLPKDKLQRKRAIKELAQRQFPFLSVTLATADALALLSVELKNSRKGTTSGNQE